MKTSSGISGIVENIMASYDGRIKSINELVKDTGNMLKGFKKERLQNDIRGSLAKADKARLHDFNNLRSSIGKSIGDICKEVSTLKTQAQAMVKGFRKERKQNDVKGHLVKNDKVRVQEFDVMMSGIHKNIEGVRQQVSDLTTQAQTMLAGFREERRRNDVKGHLAKSDKARLHDFNHMMSGINKNVSDIRKDVADLTSKTKSMMTEFHHEHEKMAADWAEMENVLAVKKGTKSAIKTAPKAPVKKAAVPPVTREVKAPVKKAAAPPVIQKEKAPLTLEEQIVKFVKKHPQGVKIGEMEKPLETTRLKLGRIAKQLLDAGKLRKEDNKYFHP
jgi:predicted  nucleic acid-binding Zn-ribbon protein